MLLTRAESVRVIPKIIGREWNERDGGKEEEIIRTGITETDVRYYEPKAPRRLKSRLAEIPACHQRAVIIARLDNRANANKAALDCVTRD